MQNYKSELIASIQSTFFVYGLTRNVYLQIAYQLCTSSFKTVENLEYRKKKRERKRKNNTNYLFVIDL